MPAKGAINMNAISGFRLYNLSNKDLISKVNHLTDEMYKSGRIPDRQIPARPNDDYDLLIGELLLRFSGDWKLIHSEGPQSSGECLVTDGKMCTVMEYFSEERMWGMGTIKVPIGQLTIKWWMELPELPIIEFVNSLPGESVINDVK